MFDLIIIAIIVGVIGNILTSIGRRHRWEQQSPPRPKDFDNMEGPDQATTPDVPEYFSTDHRRLKYNIGTTDYTERISSEDGLIDTSYNIKNSIEGSPVNATEKQRKVLFDQDSLINGVILSEILKPPKSLRRG